MLEISPKLRIYTFAKSSLALNSLRLTIDIVMRRPVIGPNSV